MPVAVRTVFVLLLTCLASAPAGAHGVEPIAPAAVWMAWTPDPWLSATLLIVVLAYARGLARLWRRAGSGRGVGWGAAASFGAGAIVIAAALLSPLDAVTGTLLSAHMVQHVLLVAVAPPLLLLGRPDAVLAFALPAGTRQQLAGSGTIRRLLSGLRRLARPAPAAALHALAIWAWHAPGPFEAALASDGLHHLEHASFFVTALLFWQSVLAAWRSPALLMPAILAILVTLIHGGFLGALITLSARPLYPAYAGSDLWGLSQLADQQLAGLIMWVPAGAVYLAAGLILGARLIGFDEPGPAPQVRAERNEPVAPAAG